MSVNGKHTYTFSTITLYKFLSRRAQYSRWSSFGKRAWFTESHLPLIISFFTRCFTYSIFVDKMKKSRAVSS